MSVDPDFRRALDGARLTTAEVFYFLPDHPDLIQSFLWQTYDVAPDYPRLMEFLEFWRREIEAAIHSVRVAHNELVKPASWRGADVEFRIH